jgi:hypothetical protein
VPQNGAQVFVTTSDSGSLGIAYGRAEADGGSSAPGGIAIFGYRSGGVLVTEAGVPASPAMLSGRIYVDQSSFSKTGLALANPSDQDAYIRFHFTNGSGDFGYGSFVLGGYRQISAFLDQPPFNGGSFMQGTFTYNSSVAISAIALRGYTNERGDFLVTTLPVASLTIVNTDRVLLPHFADGGGWHSQVVLTNTGDRAISGTVQFVGTGSAAEAGSPITVSVNGNSGTTFNYLVPARGMIRFATDGQTAAATVGSVRVSPAAGSPAPVAFVIFSFKQDGITVSEASVLGAPMGSAFRMYAESSGNAGRNGAVQSGLAISTTSSAAVPVDLEFMDLSGIVVGRVTVSVPASGQIARFVNELFPNLKGPIQGIVKISALSPVAVTGLRGRYNERGDFLITTTPPSNDALSTDGHQTLFPHVPNGGGYVTQMILLNGGHNKTAAGRLFLVSRDGVALPGGSLELKD